MSSLLYMAAGRLAGMPGYTKRNLKQDVENSAPKFDMPAEMEARFARRAIEGESLGLSHLKLDPNFRIPFGHKHEGQEEVYVIVRGSARIKVEDEIVELASGMRSASTRTRCGPSRPGRKASSTSPSGLATTPPMRRLSRDGGRTSPAHVYRQDQGRFRVMPDTAEARRSRCCEHHPKETHHVRHDH